MKKAHFFFACMVVLFFTSCHIEKRIYRPGHYISAKQHYKTETGRSDTIVPVGKENHSQATADKLPSSFPLTHSLTDSHTPTLSKNELQQDEPLPAVESQANTNTNSAPAAKAAVKPQKVGEKEAITDEGTKKGLWMIILGLLLLGIGYLISFLGVLGFIFFVIFAIGAAVYIIVGIFVIIFSS